MEYVVLDDLEERRLLDKGSVPRGTGAVICMRPDLSAVSAQNLIVPIWMI